MVGAAEQEGIDVIVHGTRRLGCAALAAFVAACAQSGPAQAPPVLPAPPADVLPMPGAVAQELVALRQDTMRRIDVRLAELTRIVMDEQQPEAQRARLLDHVRAVEDLSREVPGLFPPGSGGPPSRAQSEVWAQPERFRAAAAEFRSRVESFAEVARAGDAVRTRQAYERLDIAGACNACHVAFRRDAGAAPGGTGVKTP